MFVIFIIYFRLNPEASDLFSQPNHKLQPLIRRALRVALNYGVIQLGDGNYNLHFICRSKLKVKLFSQINWAE